MLTCKEAIEASQRTGMCLDTRQRVLALLRRVQFGSELVSDQTSLCPDCCAHPWIDVIGTEDVQRIEHKPHCELAALIRELEGER